MLPFITILTLAATLAFNNINHPKAVLALFISTLLILVSRILTKNRLNSRLNLIILFLIISNIISYIFSSTANLGLASTTAEITLLIFFSILVSTKITNTNQKKILLGISALCVLESIFGISQFIIREETRVAGTFMSYTQKANFFPNAFALFLLLTWPLTLLINNKILKIIALILSSTALFLTFSRGGLIVFIIQIISIGIYYLINQQYQIIKKIITALLISILIVFGLNQLRTQKNLAAQNINQKITFNSTEKITSVNERGEFFINTPKLIVQKPFIGFGPDSFYQIYPQVQPRFIANAPHPHNIFLKISVEKGLINLLLFISILIFTLSLIIKNNKVAKNETNFIIINTIAGGLIHNQIDYNFNFISNYFIFFILLAILLNNLIFNKENNKYTNKLNLNLKYSLLLLAIVISLNSYWLFNEIKLKTAFKIAPKSTQTAINLLNNANYLDSNAFLADIYSSNNTQKAIDILKNHIKINPYDAFAYNKLGQLLFTQNSLQESSYYYKKALETDPMNHWEFYYNYYNQNKNEIKNNKSKITTLLKSYLNQAQNNIHYTAQTPNIDYAIKLSKILNENNLTKSLQEAKDIYQVSK